MSERPVFAVAQDSNERCGLLALRAGGCLLLLLLAERVAGSMELLAGLAHEALPSLTAIAQGTAAELSSANQWHIPGMRWAPLHTSCRHRRRKCVCVTGCPSSPCRATGL